jgi:hypothetical protein
MLKSLKVKNPTGSFLLDSHVNDRERLLAENNSDVALMQGFFAKVGLSRERSIKCARKTVIRDILTPRRLFYYVQFVPEFSLLSLGINFLPKSVSDLFIECISAIIFFSLSPIIE